MRNHFKVILLAALAAAPAACNETGFKSQSAVKAQPERAATQCTDDRRYTDESLTLRVKPDIDAQLFVEGEICPRAPAALTVVFVVDFSLSMYNKEKARGNDQVINGS